MSQEPKTCNDPFCAATKPHLEHKAAPIEYKDTAPKLTAQEIRAIKREEIAEALSIPVSNICEICLSEITIMAFRGTGVCRELCGKRRDGEALNDLTGAR